MAERINTVTPNVVAHAPHPLALPVAEGGLVTATALRLAAAPDARGPLSVLLHGLSEHELSWLTDTARQTRSLAVTVADPYWHLLVVRASAPHESAPLLASNEATLGPLWSAGALAQLMVVRHRPWAMCSMRAPSTEDGLRASTEIVLTMGDGPARQSVAGLVSVGGRLAVAAAPTPQAHRREMAEAWALVEEVAW